MPLSGDRGSRKREPLVQRPWNRRAPREPSSSPEASAAGAEGVRRGQGGKALAGLPDL